MNGANVTLKCVLIRYSGNSTIYTHSQECKKISWSLKQIYATHLLTVPECSTSSISFPLPLPADVFFHK